MDQDCKNAGLRHGRPRGCHSSARTFQPRCCFWLPQGFNLCSACKKIVKLACGSFIARRLFRPSRGRLAITNRHAEVRFLPVLSCGPSNRSGWTADRTRVAPIIAATKLSAVITFGLSPMFQDVFRFLWGATRAPGQFYSRLGTRISGGGSDL